MKYLHRLLVVASAAFFIAGSALAQNPGAVTSHAFAIGKGAGTTGYTSLLCGSAQLAVGQSAADPICRTLTGDVTIDASGVTAIGTAKVTSAMLRNSAALSVIGRSANSTGVPADITCTAASDAVLRESGSVLGCGTVATGGIANNAITDAKLRQGGALSVIGRSANSTGNVADISCSAGADGVLRESGSSLGCGTVATGGLAANAVTNAKLAAMNAYTFKCNNTGSSAAPTDCDATAFTSKPSPVSGDIVIIQDSAASNAYKRTTVGALASAGSVSSLNGQTGTLAAFFPPQGRLTLVSGTPVMTSSTTGATSIYYTPAVGNMVPLYDGTNTVPTLFTELQITLGNNWTSSTNYDVFIASDSGTTRACTGPAWTAGTAGSATVRGTSTGSTELERVAANGLLMNKVQITCRYTNSNTFTVAANRGTYVGTVWIRAADSTIDWHFGAAASGGTAATFGVWNMYNRREFTALVEDTFSSAAVSQAAPAALNSSNNNRINYVIGWAEDVVVAKTFGTGVAGSSGFLQLGVCHDVTNAFSGLTASHAVNIAGPLSGSARFNGDLGFHFAQACQGANVSNGTMYGSGTIANFHTGIELTGRF